MFAFIVNALNGLIKLLGMVLGAVIAVLPDSPFSAINLTGFEKALGYVNWFCPVGLMLKTFTAWLFCIGLYYLYSIVLRWLKAVS